MNQNPSSQSQSLPAATTQKTRASDKLSATTVWMAPIIVCVALIVLGLAVAGFLLGDK
jgi:hypothetical protein